MVVYIIYSPSLDKYYIGQTDNFAERVAKHIANDDATSFSSRATDWQEFLLITCDKRTQARQIENYLKKQKSRKYIEGLKANPEWVKNLQTRFQGT